MQYLIFFVQYIFIVLIEFEHDVPACGVDVQRFSFPFLKVHVRVVLELGEAESDEVCLRNRHPIADGHVPNINFYF